MTEGMDSMQGVKVTIDSKQWISVLQDISRRGDDTEGESMIFIRLDADQEIVTFINEDRDSICKITLPIRIIQREGLSEKLLYCCVSARKLGGLYKMFPSTQRDIAFTIRTTTLSFKMGKKMIHIPNHIVKAPACETDDTTSFYKRHFDPDRVVRFIVDPLEELLKELDSFADPSIKVHVDHGMVRIQNLRYTTDSRKTGVYLLPWESFYKRLSLLPPHMILHVAMADNRMVYLTAGGYASQQGRWIDREQPDSILWEILIKPFSATTLYMSNGGKDQKGHRNHPLWTNVSLLSVREKKEKELFDSLHAGKGDMGEVAENLWGMLQDGTDPLGDIEEDLPHLSPLQQTDLAGESMPGEEEGALALLEQLPGLAGVKKQIREIAQFALFEKKRIHVLGIPFRPPALHMAFLGNPGTGKTMVARMMGKIFRELGILPKGHVIEVDRQTLVGAYVGQTEANLLKSVRRALGGILFIDEAYGLYKKDSNKDFGVTAINGLVKILEDYREKLIVIVAGYKREMFSFLSCNPGLRERIPFHIEFPDYTPEEMVQIAEWFAAKDQYTLTQEAKDALLKQVMRTKIDETFGNARTVRNWIEKAKIRHGVRVGEMGGSGTDTYTLLTAEDFTMGNGTEEERLQDVLQELEQLVGLTEVKQLVKQMIDLLAFEKKRMEHGMQDEAIALHMAFIGNPGTGKTTVARLLGRILRRLDLLPKGHFVEVGRKDLVAGYMGQTALKTAEKVKEALGGILFIDEAYALARKRDDFGAEALATLIKEMEDKKGLFTVIFSGYTKEMEELFALNPGLKSRVRFIFHFSDYTASELVEIVKQKAYASQYRLTKGAEEKLWRYFIQRCSEADESFGNGRLAEQIFERAKMNVSSRVSLMPEVDRDALATITEEDLVL